MKLKRCLLIGSILLLLVSSIPLDLPHHKDLPRGERIEAGETRSWTNTTRFIDEDFDIQGTLNIKNTTVVVNTSEADKIKVGSEGILNIEDSDVVSFRKYHERNFSREFNHDREWISIPFNKEDDSIRNVLSSIEGDYRRVLSYGAWWDHSYYESYNVNNIEDPEPPMSGELDHINRTMGAWVFPTEKTQLDITGYLTQNTVFSLKEGWNMVGYPSLKERTASDVLPSQATRLKVFNASKDYYMETISDLDSYKMKPGEGYFVEVGSDCTWNVHNPDGLGDLSKLDHTGNFTISYGSRSSGKIEGSIFRGIQGENGVLSLRSDSVSVRNSEFKDVSTGIEIGDAGATIKQNDFYDYSDKGIRLIQSSSEVIDNSFSSSQGWAITAVGSSPDIMKNTIEGGYGIYLNRSKSAVLKNEITHTEANPLKVRKGEPLVEDNRILHSDGNALQAFSSDISVRDNLFYKNGGGLIFEKGTPNVRNNRIEAGSFGLKAADSSLTFKENHVSKTIGWAVKIKSGNSTLSGNLVENCSYGVSISGDEAAVRDNKVESGGSLAYLLTDLNKFVFKDNIASYNDGLGLRIQNSHGISIGNRLIGNNGGVHLKGSSKFVNATVANNGLYGIYLSDGNPYLENVVLSGNENQALKSEGASPLIKKSSFLGSRYHIYLIESNLTAVNSFFKPQKTYQDGQSRLNNIKNLNVTMKEDTRLNDYGLVDGLPPETEILSAQTPETVKVNLRGSTIDIRPASDFHGTVNLTFRVSISENWTTTYPLIVNVTPVNDPPTLQNIEVDISYEPTNVRWEVNYTDKDNYLPTNIEVVIDGDHYSMEEVNTSDYNTSDGKLYYYEKYLEPGEHEYYIKALEDNPLGNPVPAKKRSRTIDVTPPKPDWLGLEKNTLYGIGGGFLIILILIIYFVWSGRSSLGKPDIDIEEVRDELEEGKEAKEEIEDGEEEEETEEEGEEDVRVSETEVEETEEIEEDLEEDMGVSETGLEELEKEDGYLSKISEKLEEIETSMEEMSGQSDISRFEEEKEEILQLGAEGKYIAALDKSQELKKKIEGSKTRSKKEKEDVLENRLQKARGSLSEARDSRVKISGVKKKLKSAVEAKKSGDVDEGIQYADEVIGLSEKARIVSERIMEGKEKIKELKDKDLEHKKFISKVKEAKKKADNSDYEGSLGILENTIKEMDELLERKEGKREKLKKDVGKESDEKGEEPLEEDIEIKIDHLESILDDIEEEEGLEETLTGRISEAKNKISKAREMKIDLAGMKDILHRSIKAKESGDFEEGIELTDELSDTYEKIETIYNKIQTGKNKVKELKEEDLEFKEYLNRLKEGKKKADNEEYKKAIEMIDASLEQMDLELKEEPAEEESEKGPSKKLRKIKEEVEESEEEAEDEGEGAEAKEEKEEKEEIIDAVGEPEVEEKEEEESETEKRKHRVVSDEKEAKPIKTKHRVLKGEGEKQEEEKEGEEDQESEGDNKRQRVIKED